MKLRKRVAATGMVVGLFASTGSLVACDPEDRRDVQEGVEDVQEGVEEGAEQVEQEVDENVDSDGQDDN